MGVSLIPLPLSSAFSLGSQGRAKSVKDQRLAPGELNWRSLPPLTPAISEPLVGNRGLSVSKIPLATPSICWLMNPELPSCLMILPFGLPSAVPGTPTLDPCDLSPWDTRRRMLPDEDFLMTRSEDLWAHHSSACLLQRLEETLGRMCVDGGPGRKGTVGYRS